MIKRSSKYYIRRWLILPLLAVVTFLLTEILASNPDFVENFYSGFIYPIIASVFSAVSTLVPFSLDDLFYGMLILSGFILLILAIVKKISLKMMGKVVLNVLAAVYILFYVLWGFNYYRPPLNERLNLLDREPNTAEFITVFNEIVENTNASYTGFDDTDKAEIDSMVAESYRKLAPALGLDYPGGKRTAKNITLGRFFAGAGISGYFGPFFSEVHVNPYNLPVEYPFVLAHEKAHQLGITSEAEANFYAWLVCSRSSSPELRYSANLAALRYFMYQGFHLNTFPEIVRKIDENVMNDLKEIQEHWAGLRNEKVDRVAAKVNDAYLKTNKVEKGIEDYRGLVKYVMDFKLDTAFRQQWNLTSR